MGRRLPTFHDCGKSPACCCSYPRIEVSAKELRRLAAHIGIGLAAAERRRQDDPDLVVTARVTDA